MMVGGAMTVGAAGARGVGAGALGGGTNWGGGGAQCDGLAKLVAERVSASAPQVIGSGEVSTGTCVSQRGFWDKVFLTRGPRGHPLRRSILQHERRGHGGSQYWGRRYRCAYFAWRRASGCVSAQRSTLGRCRRAHRALLGRCSIARRVSSRLARPDTEGPCAPNTPTAALRVSARRRR